MKKSLSFVVLAALFMVLSGCGTQKEFVVPDASMMNSKAIKAHREGVAIEVAMLPFVSEKDADEHFGKNLPKNKIFAAYIDIFNGFPGKANISSVTLKIKISDTVTLAVPSASSDAIYEALKKGWVAEAYAVAFVSYGLASPFSAYNTSVMNDKLKYNLETKNLKLGQDILPMGNSQGFVWYQIPEKIMAEEVFPKGKTIEVIIEKDYVTELKLLKYDLAIPD